MCNLLKEDIMAGTSEGGKKAAQNRGQENLAEAGRKGGKADHEQAARTRGQESLAEAGRKGGEHSHSGGRKKEDQ